jgi:hypothetical protein
MGATWAGPRTELKPTYADSHRRTGPGRLMTDGTEHDSDRRRSDRGRNRRTNVRKPGRGADFGTVRLFGLLAFTSVLAWLAWQVIVNISPRHHADEEDTAAVITVGARLCCAGATSGKANPGHRRSVDWAEIRRTASQILGAHPLESRAFFLLGLVAEAEGQADQAVSLMDIAAARSLRDRRAHLWLFSHRLKHGEFEQALNHADVILRTRPQLGATLLPALMAVAAIPEGRAQLIERLEKAPPWRRWFLTQFSRRAADPSDPLPLYAELQAGSHPPSSAELRPHLDRLIGTGQFEQALLVWLNSLAPHEAQRLDYLFNGDFERPVSNLPFDWMFDRVRGADIDVSDSPFDGGKALRIQFARARVPFRHVRKLVMLPPGAYVMSGKAMARDLQNERGLVWSLACAEGSKEALVSTGRIAGTMTAEIAEQFTVPVQGCRAQWLRLELAARIPSEQAMGGGTVWYDSLQIQRIAAPPPS